MIFIEVAVQKFRQSAQIIPFSKMFTMAVAEKNSTTAKSVWHFENDWSGLKKTEKKFVFSDN